MREIYIRKLHYDEAYQKLDREFQTAFVEGETYVEVVHGIGEGILKKMTIDYVSSQDFLKLVARPEMIRTNPGVTLVEILAPSSDRLRKYLR
ncbi:Smr/MutS family protein [Leptospira sp. GIMC2001]|uniref:Smr/MutS family protein n=1 Tax=Leptospira sp. GIMC2001 TaxID=1513297 RepID=UPI00234A458B|nr:Smr/MutS family protein [Leptospira sp. GIMC2001]WCL48203.1 Smr/MutS family protein [Leptospira sp. GIMC2001]